MIVLDTDSDLTYWYKTISGFSDRDVVLTYTEEDVLIWFLTNFRNFCTRNLSCEVVTLGGKSIVDLPSFMDQLNLSLVSGFKVKYDLHALYDLLLNFETEPQFRFIFYPYADVLLKEQPGLFADIFERMAVSAFCNRNGISTLKPDGSKYLVNQRNFFFLKKESLDLLHPIMDKEYYIPSIYSETEGYIKLNFEVVKLT